MRNFDGFLGRLQFVSLVLFLSAGGLTLGLGLWTIWGDAGFSETLGKMLQSSLLVMVVSALAISASRIGSRARVKDPG